MRLRIARTAQQDTALNRTVYAYPSVLQRAKIPLAKAEVGMPQRERAHCPKGIEDATRNAI